MTAAVCSLLMVEVVVSPVVAALLVAEVVLDALADTSELGGGGGGLAVFHPELPGAALDEGSFASAKLDAKA